MKKGLFSGSIVFMFSNPLIILIVVFGLIIIGLLLWNIRLEKRLRKVFFSETHNSIDDVISAIINQTTTLEKGHNLHREALEILDERLQKVTQASPLKRFNAWGDTGGNQSFAVAFVNEEGDGIILSSLYARERMSLFAKPVKNWRSEYELSQEEEEVLKNHPKYEKH